MYRTANTLPEQIRSRSVALLNRHLAAAIDLHAQVKQAHWNVRGPAFIAIHELFDKVADAVEGYSDARRARCCPRRHGRREDSDCGRALIARALQARDRR